MKDSKKIKYNLLVGIMGQLVTLALGIIVPKLVLTSFGSAINGLLSSVTNIYAYASIVEAGITAASCQALYKAIAEKNKKEINGVLSATNAYYHRTGIIYLAIIVLFSIIYPLMLSSQIPYTTVVLVVLFNGIGNAINYFFHGKYLVLLKADGKNYIRTGVEIFTTTFKQVAKIVFISMGYDVVWVQFVAMLVSFMQMIYITWYIKRRYAWVNLKETPNFEAISQSKNVLVHQINYLIFSNTDTVILTIFSTLQKVSVYSLYIMLYNMIDKLLHIIRDALEFKIASFFYIDKKEFLSFFRMYEVYYIAISFSLYSIATVFVLPFMKVYTQGITDIQYVINYLPLFFVGVKLLTVVRYPYDAMVHIAGHFKQTQKYAIVESVVNIIFSLIFVHRFEIAGVLFATIIASMYRTILVIRYIYKTKIVEAKMFRTYKCIFVNIIVFVSIECVNKLVLPVEAETYTKIIAVAIPYGLVICAIYFFINSMCEPKTFLYAWGCLQKILRKRNKKL